MTFAEARNEIVDLMALTAAPGGGIDDSGIDAAADRLRSLVVTAYNHGWDDAKFHEHMERSQGR